MLTSRDATRHRRPGATINGYDASIDKHNMMNGTGRRVMNGTGHRSQVYDVDHLATFTVGTHHGVLYAEDGMRKLRVMENTTGIWTMRCQLLLDERQVVVIDKQTGEELERYHWGQVSDPTAIISHDRSEVFNNILLFTVHEEPSRSDPVSEMHIFQAGGHPAKEIVEDMKAAQLGQTIGVRTSRRQSPQQQISPRPAESRHMPLRSRPSRGTKMLQDALESQTTGTITDRSDFQIKVLNHCFDDIERFIIRLQVSAEAFRELGRRKASKHKTSGMLRMRATVPPAGDFMDVFAKFKLAFNLLGELKSLIRDPNAPEIVHFLFTPLALMVAASKDPTTHESNLASKVISPLLTRNAKDLLEYCLSTKEHDEWMRLGEAWTMCSDEWIGAVRPYYPQFGDGWQPAVALLDAMFDNQAHEAPIYSNVNRLNTSRNSSHGQSSPPSARYSGDSVGGIHDKPPLEQSTARNEPYVHRRRETTPEPPPFRPDLHKLDVPQDDIRPSRHHSANQHVSHHQHSNHHSGSYQNPMYAPPNNYSAPNPQAHANYHLAPNHRHERVDRYSSDDEQLNFTERIRKNGTRCFEVRADRKAANKKELSVRRGEAVEILDDKKNWWLVRNAQGRKGFVPYTILRPWELHSDGEHTVQNSRGAEFSSAHFQAAEQQSPARSENSNNSAGYESERASFIRNLRSNAVTDDNPRSTPLTVEIPEIPQAPPPPPLHAPRRRQSQRPEPRKSEVRGIGRESEARGLGREEAAAVAAVQAAVQEDVREVQRGTHLPTTIHEHSALVDDSRTTHVQTRAITPRTRQDNTDGRRASTQGHTEIQQELYNRVTSGRSGKKPVPTPPRASNDMYITADSSSTEITNWLHLKGFSSRCQMILNRYDGYNLFRLSRHEFDDLLGEEEGSRLFSQLTVQKSLCGFQSQRDAQLKAILAQRRRQADKEDESPPPDYGHQEHNESDSEEESKFDRLDKTLRAQLIRQRQKLASIDLK